MNLTSPSLAAAFILPALVAPHLHAAPGDVDTGFAPNPNNNMSCALSQPNGAQVLLGNFTSIAGGTRSYAARLSDAGVLDAGFTANGAPGSGFTNPGMFCGAVQDDGKIVIGGLFAFVNGVSRNFVARVNANGSLDTSFTASSGSQIRSMLMQPDGRIVLAGSFTTMNGIARSRVARLNPDGTLDAVFNPNAGDFARTVALQPDGKVVVGGSFTTMSGQPRAYVARVNADGALDTAFDPMANGTVYSVAVQPDGKIIIGGTFTSVGGIGRSNIARLHADGTVDAAFNPGASGNVRSSILQADGKILIGGEFTVVAGTARSRVARLNPNGTLDTTFNASANTTVYGVTLQADGKVGLSGEFSTVNGTSRTNFARLLNDPAAQSLQAVDAGRVEWLRGGSSPEASSVILQFSVNGGATWSPALPGTRMSGGWEFTGLTLPDTGLLRARARTAGGYNNGAGGLVESTAAFNLTTAIGTWRQENFGTSANAGDAANTADPDNDGLDNLCEFALGLDPLAPDSAELPEWQNSGGNYVVDFQSPPGVSGISYTAERSSTLAPGSWSTVPNSAVPPLYHFSAPASPAARQYFRLRITEP